MFIVRYIFKVGPQNKVFPLNPYISTTMGITSSLLLCLAFSFFKRMLVSRGWWTSRVEPGRAMQVSCSINNTCQLFVLNLYYLSSQIHSFTPQIYSKINVAYMAYEIPNKNCEHYYEFVLFS